MGRLSTHILDTVQGRPAQNVAIELHALDGQGGWRKLQDVRTNSDGRTDGPLMSGADFQTGTYMLTFHIGDYFRTLNPALPEPPFLDLVPLRFSMADADGHYHVPLLVSPWSYSTYRGS